MEIQYKNLIDEIEKQQKGKKQNGRHAKTINNTLYVYIPGPRAPERWERWDHVPSQFVILAATFG